MKRILLFGVFIPLFLGSITAQNNYTDRLKQQLISAKQDTNKVKILLDLGIYYQWDKPDSSIKYGLEGKQLSEKLNYTHGEISSAISLGEALSAKGNYSEALTINLKATQTAKKTGNEREINNLLLNRGGIYFYSGDYKKALTYYLKWRKSFDNKQKTGFSLTLAMGFIGETYYHLNQLDSALLYINKACQLDKNSDTNHWSIPYYYLALIQQKQHKLEDALKNNKLGLSYSQVSNDIAKGYTQIASVYKELGQADSSVYYAKMALNLSQDESLTPKILDATSLLTALYIPVNTDSAFKYQQLMLAAKDSLFSEEKVKQMQNLSFNEKMRLKEIEAAQQKYQYQLRINAFLGSTFTLIVIAVFLFLLSRRKQKAKQKIESAFNQLKATQSQLIQSEKMASLGELTAGIAHEIQNPLNFVNNFSELSRELIGEMNDELEKGDINEAKEIGKDIEKNLEKIHHHGERASSIVKGMLQHSRTSNGQKELTDINALADEYLRLAYHGLRAKDKSFNADFKTEFDESLPKINIIPQDIGRVLLNLINNAFYAVDKRAKETTPQPPKGGEGNVPNDYMPTVIVTTEFLKSPSGDLGVESGQGVKISVKDNGPGIPSSIVDKIFQPFFTTKPTGSGTGLGLSLSYDIVKAHGGELKVETKTGHGSEFIILIPAD